MNESNLEAKSIFVKRGNFGLDKTDMSKTW